MWRKVSVHEETLFLEQAIIFTGDAELYGKYMMHAINKWPISCEHNLTCVGMNRQAFIGHAATCIAIECPEYITRLAWHQLTEDQQNKANEKADIAIKIWEESYAKNKDWNRCIDGGQTPDFMDVRHLREGLPLFQCREGQYGNAASSSGRGQEAEKKIRIVINRPRRAVQNDNGSCERLF
jgi:hypothetical protein